MIFEANEMLDYMNNMFKQISSLLWTQHKNNMDIDVLCIYNLIYVDRESILLMF